MNLGAADAGGRALVAECVAARPISRWWPSPRPVGGPRVRRRARPARGTTSSRPPTLLPSGSSACIEGALERRRLRQELRAAQAGAPETLNLEARERQAILAALEATRWNKQAAARLLGLHRPTLYAKMRKHGIPQARPH